jgi:hypothetical protein
MKWNRALSLFLYRAISSGQLQSDTRFRFVPPPPPCTIPWHPRNTSGLEWTTDILRVGLIPFAGDRGISFLRGPVLGRFGSHLSSSGHGLRGVNTLQFEIASLASAAFSTFRPPPGPCSSAIGPKVPVRGGAAVQELAGAPSLRQTRPSGYMLGAERPCFLLGCRHPKCIQHRLQ